MKILQIINSLSTGGAEKLLLETIPMFQTKGFKIDLLVLDGSFQPFLEELKKTNCCKIYSLGTGTVYNPLHILKIIPYLKKYDVVHIHLFPALYWVGLAKIVSLSKTKLIFTEHSTFNRRLGFYFYRQIDKIIYHVYNKVVAITPAVKNELVKKLKLSKEKCIIINNGVNLDKIEKAISLNREVYTKSTDAILLIQISRFNAEKDHKTLINAMKLLPENIELLLIGDGLLRVESEQLVDKLGLKKRVQFLGIRMDVPELLKTSDIVIQSSHWEGFGLAALEGMAAKKPVIASNVPGLKEVVERAGILFDKGNAEHLAYSIKLLIDNTSYYNEISEKCYARAQRYSIETMANKTIELYKSINPNEGN